jgi:hypothetical protein
MKSYWFGVFCRVVFYFTSYAFATTVVATVYGLTIFLTGDIGMPLAAAGFSAGIVWVAALKWFLDFGRAHLDFDECAEMLEEPPFEDVGLSDAQIVIAQRIQAVAKELETAPIWGRTALRREIRLLLARDSVVASRLRETPGLEGL